jgi:hypothetical protein
MEEKMRGKYWLMQPFSIGKHEQMMHVFTSRELQMAAMGPSQVLSFEVEATYIACRRSREAIQVLVRLSEMFYLVGFVMGKTYIPPTQNTKVSAIFWRFGRLRLFNIGNGARAIPQSLRMFSPALLNLYHSC